MRWLLAPFVALLTLAAGQPALGEAAGPTVFFTPPNPPQWPVMFADDSQWPRAAKRLQVLTLVSGWVAGATDEQILTVTNFAKAHNIKIELDLQAVEKKPTDTCGGVEGMGAPAQNTGPAMTLRRLGVQVDYFDMDEPVWFGHYSTDPAACQYAIDELVARTAVNLNQVYAIYPNASLIDIEPFPAVSNNPDWKDVLAAYYEGIHQATGKHVESLQADVDWDNPDHRRSLLDMRQFLSGRNMRMGIYYVGSAYDMSDAGWIAHAMRNIGDAEGFLGIQLDEAVFASWNQFGQNNIPETDPATQTWLIAQYARRRHTTIEAEFIGRGAAGRLMDRDGHPIANAQVLGQIPGVDWRVPLPVTTVTGTVPPNAATALLAYRLSTECFCAGYNDVLIGTITYQETQGGSVRQTWLPLFPQQVYQGVTLTVETVGGQTATRVISPSGTNFAPGSPSFAVTPGAAFQFSIPASTVGGRGWYGYFCIIWFDQNGNGIIRTIVTPSPGWVTSSSAVTGQDGRFKLPRLPKVPPATVPVRILYNGDANHQPTAWSPFR